MAKTEKQLLEALKKIAEIASSITNDENASAEKSTPAGQDDSHLHSDVSCSIKNLPKRLREKAANTAVQINPVNAPNIGPLAELADDNIASPLSLTLLTSKYWGPYPRKLTVSFMEKQPAALRAKILNHMNAWTKTECISFVETNQTGQVRISTGPGGYWSYLGTDILHIPANRPTMNLERFSLSTPDSEFVRVVRHETGHTLGFTHEHMRKELVQRIDPKKAYPYFLQTQGWNKQMVDQQVLTPLDAKTIMGTPADQTSIMCYQLPGSITFDGKPILGGKDINATDYTFAGLIYPKTTLSSPAREEEKEEEGEDWKESEDVEVNEIFDIADQSLSGNYGASIHSKFDHSN